MTFSDGTLEAFGGVANGVGQCDVPSLPLGLRYERAQAGSRHTLALRSDGALVAFGENGDGRCSVPTLPAGTSYTDFDAGHSHSIALRSDGVAVAFGSSHGTVLPPLPPGLRYVEVDANDRGTLLRRSDGALLFTGLSYQGNASPPSPPPGLSFVDIGLGYLFSGAIASDGTAVLWGGLATSSIYWRPLPSLPPGVVYVEIDGGSHHLALRRSDGQIVVVGNCAMDQHRVPGLESGQSYVGVSAGGILTVGRVGPTCTYVSFATGCAGTRPAARLVPRDTPRIGRRHQVTVFDLPQNLAIMLFGWSRTPPTPLASYGMPGCDAHVSPDGAFLLLGQNGQARYELPIPDARALVGLRFFNQAVVLDPGANAGGAVVSAAAEGVIGYR